MTNDEAKRIFLEFLAGEKITRGQLMDAIHIASVEAMKATPDDQKLVDIFEGFAKRIKEAEPK